MSGVSGKLERQWKLDDTKSNSLLGFDLSKLLFGASATNSKQAALNFLILYGIVGAVARKTLESQLSQFCAEARGTIKSKRALVLIFLATFCPRLRTISLLLIDISKETHCRSFLF